jgi:hypothetical protein
LPALQTGAVCVAAPGEEVCGDSWAAVDLPGRSLVMASDGLGHGPGAAQASQIAIQLFLEAPQLGPTRLLQIADDALRSTRGAVVAIAEIDFTQRQLRFAGIGNIVASIVSARSCIHLVSHNGTLGHSISRIQEFTHPWPADARS